MCSCVSHHHDQSPDRHTSTEGGVAEDTWLDQLSLTSVDREAEEAGRPKRPRPPQRAIPSDLFLPANILKATDLQTSTIV